MRGNSSGKTSCPNNETNYQKHASFSKKINSDMVYDAFASQLMGENVE